MHTLAPYRTPHSNPTSDRHVEQSIRYIPLPDIAWARSNICYAPTGHSTGKQQHTLGPYRTSHRTVPLQHTLCPYRTSPSTQSYDYLAARGSPLSRVLCPPATHVTSRYLADRVSHYAIRYKDRVSLCDVRTEIGHRIEPTVIRLGQETLRVELQHTAIGYGAS
eukprot:669987-Rhodomonas_salina.2